MKILLVRPWVNKNITTVKNFLFGEPLGLECVATILKDHGHQVELVDFMVEDKGKLRPWLESFQPEAVGITSQCTDVENVLAIAEETKNYDKDIAVIVGGVQATVYPNSFFHPSVDYVFHSTTRANYQQVMEDIQRGNNPPEMIEGVYSQSLDWKNNLEFCMNEYVDPDTDSTRKYRSQYKYVCYQPCAVIQTSTGCRNRCSFCVRWKLEGPLLRQRDIHQVVDQIERLEEPYVMICDNDFLIGEERLTTFCNLLKERNIHKEYICYGSVNSILEKPHLLAQLREAGLVAVIVGYESFDDRELKKYNKAAVTDDNILATELLHENNIACWGSFILHPDWSREDFKKLNQYRKALKPDMITFSPLNPHPLTPLFDEYRDRLLYQEEDYEKWNFGDVLIMPSKMSLRSYYLQVIRFALIANLNPRTVAYSLKTFPLKRILKMVFGFNALFGVYVKNIIRGKVGQVPE